jgi:hypothetical protein
MEDNAARRKAGGILENPMSSKNKKNKMQQTPDNKALQQTPGTKPVTESTETKSEKPAGQVNGLSIEMDKRAFE